MTVAAHARPTRLEALENQLQGLQSEEEDITAWLDGSGQREAELRAEEFRATGKAPGATSKTQRELRKRQEMERRLDAVRANKAAAASVLDELRQEQREEALALVVGRIREQQERIRAAYADAGQRLADLHESFLEVRDAIGDMRDYLWSSPVVAASGGGDSHTAWVMANSTFVVHPVPRDFMSMVEMLWEVSADPHNYGFRSLLRERGERPLDDFDVLRKVTVELEDLPVPDVRTADMRGRGTQMTGLMQGRG